MLQKLELKDHYILGAIIGDTLGSPYEWKPVKSRQFNIINSACRFTDDTVMTIATMKSLVDVNNDGRYMPASKEITDNYRLLGRKYIGAGYGGHFRKWLCSDEYKPYGSFGNGSGMRVSPVGWWANTEDDVIQMATDFSKVSHNHPEGIKGGVAIALAVFYARQGLSKRDIADKIVEITEYNLQRTLADIEGSGYEFDVSCQGSVPESIISFLESRDYMDAITNAICLKGDTDTMACMAGAIAESYYKQENIPLNVREFVWNILPYDLKAIVADFSDIVYKRLNTPDYHE